MATTHVRPLVSIVFLKILSTSLHIWSAARLLGTRRLFTYDLVFRCWCSPPVAFRR